MKVLHCMYELGLGGLETWVMRLNEMMHEKVCNFDFLVLDTYPPGELESIAEQFGSTIFRCPHPRHFFEHSRYVTWVLRNHGPFDAVHCHDPMLGGTIMPIARWLGINTRVLHFHNVLKTKQPVPISKRIYSSLARLVANRFATHIFCCSNWAAEEVFGINWRNQQKVDVMYCGRGFTDFEDELGKPSIRPEWNIPDDAIVLGHIGSFTAQKNHAFMIGLMEHLIKLENNYYFFFVGDGPLMLSIKDLVDKKKLSHRIMFSGNQKNVAKFLMRLFDGFIFPSLYEGLGIVCYEAQAAALPCVISDRVPNEAIEIDDLVITLPLDIGAKRWADEIDKHLSKKHDIDINQAFNTISEGKFNLSNNVEWLAKVYAGLNGI